MDLYGTNLGRAYPLQSLDDVSTDDVLVDLKVIVRSRLQYSHRTSEVSLWSYSQADDDLRERLNLPAEAKRFVVFAVVTPSREVGLLGYSSSDTAFDTVALTAYPLDELKAAVMGTRDTTLTGLPSLANGWAVLGKPAAFPVTPQIVAVPAEPSRVLAVTEPGPNESVTYLYNAAQTQYSPPAGCIDTDPTSVTVGYHLAMPAIAGAFTLRAGNQISISQNPPGRLLLIRADGSPGDSDPVCLPVPLSDVGGPVYDTDTAPRCNEVMQSFNGLSGVDIVMAGYNGATVRGYPSMSRIVINAPVRGVAGCETINLGDDPPDEELNPPIDCGTVDPTYDVTSLPFSRSGLNSGRCRFVADTQLKWQIDNYGCVSPTFCQSPAHFPLTPGEVALTDCQLAGDTATIIRNSYFVDSVAFNFWERSPGTAVVRRANAWINAGQLPMAQLYDGQWIQQRLLGVLPSQAYALQADVRLLSGTFEFTLSDSVTGRQLWSSAYRTDDTTHQTVAWAVPPLGASLVDLHIRYNGAGDPAFIGYLAITAQ